MREQRDHAEAGAEAEQRGHDRQAHRDQRAERQQQHDDRREQPDGGGDAEARLLGRLDRLPAELDLQARRAPAARATSTTRSAALLGSTLAFSSNTTVANAIWPLAEIDLPAAAPA